MTIDFNITIFEVGAASDSPNQSGVPFPLAGGRYGLTARSQSYGTLSLKKLAGDGSTYVTVASFTSDGVQSVQLAPGTYQVTTPPGSSYLDIVQQRRV